jgi:hypothetical protein
MYELGVRYWHQGKGHTGAHDVNLLHLAVGALDEPVRELLDGRRLEVGIRGIGVQLHLGIDSLEDVPAAVSEAGYTRAAAGIKNLWAISRVPVVALCLFQDRKAI